MKRNRICRKCRGLRHPVQLQSWSGKQIIRDQCRCRSVRTVGTVKVQKILVGGRVVGYQVTQLLGFPYIITLRGGR